MTDPVAVAVSTLALAVSITTAWLTLLRRGTVHMTRPTQIFFGPDSSRSRDDTPSPKIYLRTLLFASSKRGRVIESMHVTITRDESRQTFNIWVYGEREKLVRGSGLFIGETGVEANHHFLTPPDATTFLFVEGHYKLEVFAHLLGSKQQKLLFSQTLEITADVAQQLREPDAGLYFDWGPDSSRYLTHVERRPPRPTPADLEWLGLIPRAR